MCATVNYRRSAVLRSLVTHFMKCNQQSLKTRIIHVCSHTKTNVIVINVMCNLRACRLKMPPWVVSYVLECVSATWYVCPVPKSEILLSRRLTQLLNEGRFRCFVKEIRLGKEAALAALENISSQFSNFP